jgi:hypothetical protein
VSISEISFVVRVTSRESGLRVPLDGGAMVYTLSYQMYKSEHGLSAAEQRAADVRAGQAAAAVRDGRLRLGRAQRRWLGGRPAGRAADVGTGTRAGSMRLLSSGR